MYTALADVYDLFYEEDTQARTEYYARFLPANGEGVDIGCGTGALTLALWRRGLRIYGLDKSAAMLSKASDAALRMGANVRFVAGDAGDLRVLHPLDFAVAANDVYNYVPKLRNAFRSVWAALREGGVFAFDVSSAYKLREVLAGNVFSETKNDVTYVWKNFRSGNKLNIDFTVFTPAGASYIKTCETQTQYIRSCEEITAALREAGFRRVRAYAFYSTRKPTPKTERIVFIAEK